MLSREEAKEFFGKVKGKQITWTGWKDSNHYFIPYSLINGVLMIGSEVGSSGGVREDVVVHVVNGFGMDEGAGSAPRWKLIGGTYLLFS